nr:recombinase family protein [Pontibacter vulgaris]
MNRAALLVRISTADQSYDRQISQLTEFAESRNLTVVETIAETISGAKKNEDRKGIQRLLELAQTGKINKLLVHDVTRLGRITSQVLTTLETLHHHRVSVIVMNYNLETLNKDGSVNPMTQFLITILTDLGRMERITLIERVKSGLQEARRKGKVLGRPKNSTKAPSKVLSEYKQVVKYLNDGYTIRETAKLCDVGISTVQRVKKLVEEQPA